MRNTYAEVSLGTIRANYRALKKHSSGTKVCAVVKADAYGHGLIQVAQALVSEGVGYFAVAIAEEGVLLREAGIATPILVLGSITPDQVRVCLFNNLAMTASSREKLRAIYSTATQLAIPAVVHLKVDTGMGRIGVHFERAEEFLKEAKELSSTGMVICEGLYSHLAECCDENYSRLQFERFMKIKSQAESLGLQIPLHHICNSGGIFLYPEFHLSMVRPGVALYGIEPETACKVLPDTIRPALTWKTEVVYFKVVKQGEFVGYGKTWSPKEEYERVVTIPVGYADGLSRRLSNTGYVLLRGKKYPIVGRVCMDQAMVSIGKGGESYLGDPVVLLGKDGDEVITVQDMASWIDAAPHEITTLISARVPRVYI